MVRLIQFTLGRDKSRVDAVALIRQQSCSYSRRGPVRAGVVVEKSSLLWKRSLAHMLVTCGAVVGSRDGAIEEERVCARMHVSMVASCAEHNAPKLAAAISCLRAS